MSDDSSSTTPKTQQAPRRVPWGPVAAVLMVLFGFIVVPIAAGVLISVIPHLLGWSSVAGDEWLLNSAAANFLYVLIAEAIGVLAVLWFVSYKKTSFLDVVGLRNPKLWDVVYAILGWFVYMLLFVVVLAFVQALTPINTSQEQALGFERGVRGIGLVMAFVSLVILPPIAEEIIFRGFFYGTLRSSKVPALWSAGITSVFFGALHLLGSANGGLLWIAFVDTFVLSMVLCYVRERRGSIWACIGIHALKNGFVFVNLFLLS